MNSLVGTFSPYTFYEDTYESVSELVDFNMNRPYLWSGSGSWDSKRMTAPVRDDDGVRIGYLDSVFYAKNGTSLFDDDFAEALRVKRKLLDRFLLYDNRSECIADVVGYSPRVPAALIGHPKSMYRRVKRPKRVRDVEIFFDIACPWHVPASSRVMYGMAVLSAVDLLMSLGYRVKLSIGAIIVYRENGDKVVYSSRYTAKDYGGNIVPSKILFPACSRASLVHLFTVAEQRGHEMYGSSGNGYDMFASSSQADIVRKILTYYAGKKILLLSNGFLNKFAPDSSYDEDLFDFVVRYVVEMADEMNRVI